MSTGERGQHTNTIKDATQIEGEKKKHIANMLSQSISSACTIKFVPIFIFLMHILVQGLELGAAGNGQIERLGGEKRRLVKQVKVVAIGEVRQQLPAEAIQIGERRNGQPPAPVAGPVEVLGKLKWLMIEKPLNHRRILFFVKLHRNRFNRLNI